MRGFLAAVLAVAALGLQPAVRAEPPLPATPHLVTVDVIATDARGRAIDDLKPADFEVREEGALQALEGGRFVRAAVGPASATPIAIRSSADERLAATPDEARLIAIFMDEYHVSAGASTERARAALERFVDREIGPRDLVVVMKPLDSVLAIRTTRDLDAVRRTIESFEGRKGEYAPRNAYERDYIAGTPARIEMARNQVVVSAINALAVHLGSLTNRRKTLVVVTEGVARAARRGQDSPLATLATLDTISRSANRANVSLYTVDPREASADHADQDALGSIAAVTDGQIIAGDLDAGLQRAAEDSSAYYLLTYRSSFPEDGTFHEVQVRVKRAGARVRARSGYWAPSPEDAMRAALIAKMNEPKPIVPPEPAPHVSPMIRPWFGMSRGAGGATRITFVWEPAGRVPGDRVRQGSPSRIVLTALKPDGTVLFQSPVLPTGPAAIDDPATISARAVFDAPPGRLKLRMSIQDVTSKVLDQDVRDLAIRDLRGEVAIGTPEVMRARNAREFRTLEAEAAVPVASREFSRTERLLIRFQAYGPAGARPSLSAKLLSRTGQAMRELTVEPASTPDGENAIDLPLAGLAAGEYAIEVKAKSGSGDATDRIAFRVTP
jgi:VWFA-related protein